MPRLLHVFETWADDICSSTKLVAEVLHGEQWAWAHEVHANAPVIALNRDWWDREAAAQRLVDFVQSIELPAGIQDQWIEEVVPAPVADGLFMIRHDFARTACTEACGRLQIVQVVYATPNPDMPMPPIDDWEGCVDAGRQSVWHRRSGRAPGHPTRPYFHPPRVYRGEGAAADTVHLVDDVGSAIAHAEMYLEAAGVCIRHLGNEQDRMLSVYRFGWREWGDVLAPGPEVDPGPPVEADAASEMFRRIVERDYPEYVGVLQEAQPPG